MQTAYITNIESLLQKIFFKYLRTQQSKYIYLPCSNRAITDNIRNFLWKKDPYYVSGLENHSRYIYEMNENVTFLSQSQITFKRTLKITNRFGLSTPRRIQLCTKKDSQTSHKQLRMDYYNHRLCTQNLDEFA